MAQPIQVRNQEVSAFAVRHRSAREAVMASQRGRVLQALVQVTATKGYAETTIADIVAAAAVSRRTFYELFRDKEECFLAAFEVGVDFVFARIREEFVGVDRHDWRGRLRVVIETYLSTLASEPEFAKVAHVDVLAAGDRARERWAEVLQQSVALCRPLQAIARKEDPRIPEVSDEILLVLLGGITELVRAYVLTERIERLPEQAASLTALAIATLSGAGQA